MGKRAIIEALRHYFSTQPVLKAWLFGSFSRGEETKDSDVDIMVSLDKSKPIGLKFFGMWSDLEELLGRKVDLVSEGTLLPPKTPWKQVNGMRNYIVHEYFQVDNNVVWDVITNDLPVLEQQIKEYLTEEK